MQWVWRAGRETGRLAGREVAGERRVGIEECAAHEGWRPEGHLSAPCASVRAELASLVACLAVLHQPCVLSFARLRIHILKSSGPIQVSIAPHDTRGKRRHSESTWMIRNEKLTTSLCPWLALSSSLSLSTSATSIRTSLCNGPSPHSRSRPPPLCNHFCPVVLLPPSFAKPATPPAPCQATPWMVSST